ncbi:MAG: 16S rRNA (guanine(527)-N(7))-methyltransferase RsmG [Bacillota bacterium]
MANDFLKTLELGLTQLEMNLSKQQLDRYVGYYKLLLDWNQKINLTAIKDPKEIAIKHFLDSQLLTKWLKVGADTALLDLGTGAGFPGLVLKILNPETAITLVDAVQKKVNFINLVAKELSLIQVAAIHSRAEDLGKDLGYREGFTDVTARAVAPLAVLAEYGLPLLKKGGKLFALKGPNYRDELEKAKDAIDLLGGKLAEVVDYKLPLIEDQRSLIIIRKDKKTPQGYPRKSGIPSKMPLKRHQNRI